MHRARDMQRQNARDLPLRSSGRSYRRTCRLQAVARFQVLWLHHGQNIPTTIFHQQVISNASLCDTDV